MEWVHAAVRPLVNAGIGIATGNTVPAWMHETWEALPGDDGITYRELGARLEMGDDGAKKRVAQMIPLGYADNLETRPRAAAKFIRATEPPRHDNVGFLPTVGDVAAYTIELSNPWTSLGSVGRVSEASSHALSQTDHGQSDTKSDLGLDDEAPTTDIQSDQRGSGTEGPPTAMRAELPTRRTRTPPAALVDQKEITESWGNSDASFVLLEDHDLGPHTLEVWGPPADQRTTSATGHQPTGQPIGTCAHCGGAVGDQDPTYAYREGGSWSFTGYGYPDMKPLPPGGPLLCFPCAIRVKYGLLETPAPKRARVRSRPSNRVSQLSTPTPGA